MARELRIPRRGAPFHATAPAADAPGPSTYAYATDGIRDHIGGSHMHGPVEVIYVLSGTYEHEVNGRRYSLTPGMVGIVRPGDKVRHLVPMSGPAKPGDFLATRRAWKSVRWIQSGRQRRHRSTYPEDGGVTWGKEP